MNNLIIHNTSFYIWNDESLIKTEEIFDLFMDIGQKSMFDFKIEKSETYTSLSLSNNDLSIKFYNNGYVCLLEGKILFCMLFLYEFDRYFNPNKKFCISPTQRLEENNKFYFQRGLKIVEIARFLDDIFNNNDYSQALKIQTFN